MAHAAVPGVEQIGKTVIGEACDRLDERQTDEPREPGVARREPPDGDGAIGADVRDSPSASTACRRRRTSSSPAPKRDSASGSRLMSRNSMTPARAACYQTIALPVDAGVTDRAFGIGNRRSVASSFAPRRTFRHVAATIGPSWPLRHSGSRASGCPESIDPRSSSPCTVSGYRFRARTCRRAPE